MRAGLPLFLQARRAPVRGRTNAAEAEQAGEPMKPDFLSDLQARGLLHQMSSPAVADALRAARVTAYIGFDPTADSLHVGSLLQLVTLRRLQEAGHRPIALVGGGTGLIGDPSGKESERTMLTPERLERNLAGIRAQIDKFLDFQSSDGLVLNNADWLTNLRLIDFLRDVGKHFSVNAMITRDSVRNRLEQREHGISYTEFSYCLLQSFDFLELYDRHGCTLQMGGSDQWGNIVAGADLIRRLRGAEVHGVTIPLVTRADGRKFGKSEEGNVWLDPARTSPYQFHQFWLNIEDADVIRFLHYFTFLTPAQVTAEYAPLVQSAPQERAAQRRLADEMTRMVHGDDALARAHKAANVLFRKDADYRELSAQELREAFAGAPTSDLEPARLDTPQAALVSVLAECGLHASKGRAREDVVQGAISINNTPQRDPQYILSKSDVLSGGFLILRKGKKSFHVLRIAAS